MAGNPLHSFKLFSGTRNFSPAVGFNPVTAPSIPRLIWVNPEQNVRRRRYITMNRPMFKRVFPQTLVWAGLVVLCGVNALAQDTAAAPPPAAEVRADGQIEMDVVHALDSSQALKNELITAATMQSEVTLSGTVASESSRKLAETIAAQVAGVTKVNDNLKVVSAQAAEDTGNNGDQDQDMDQPQPGNAGVPNPAGAPNSGPGQPVTQDQIRAEVQSQIQAQRQAQLQTPSGPVTVPPGTLLKLRTNEPVGSKRAKDGQPVEKSRLAGVRRPDQHHGLQRSRSRRRFGRLKGRRGAATAHRAASTSSGRSLSATASGSGVSWTPTSGAFIRMAAAVSRRRAISIPSTL